MPEKIANQNSQPESKRTEKNDLTPPVKPTMPNHGMTPHTSGTSLSAQARYAAGTREILECFFDKQPIRNQYLIVKDGELAGMGAHSYSKGSATEGSEEAAQYKK